MSTNILRFNVIKANFREVSVFSLNLLTVANLTFTYFKKPTFYLFFNLAVQEQFPMFVMFFVLTSEMLQVIDVPKFISNILF